MPALLIVFFVTFLVGCGDNPGKWNIERVGSEMERYARMDELVLTKHDDGSVTAEGIGGNGRRYTFTIEQDSKKKELKWTSFDENGKQVKTHSSRER